mgnify:CR=1 FL=1
MTGVAEMGFFLPIETMTIKEGADLIRSLDIDGTYEIGGDDGAIWYDLYGEVIIHEIEDEHMPKMLKIIFDEGCCPHFIDLYEGNGYFTKDELASKFVELHGDTDALWIWIKQAKKEEMQE